MNKSRHTQLRLLEQKWSTRMLKVIGVAFLLISNLLLAPFAHAQSDYPNKPIMLVLAFLPGGVIDSVGRKLAQQLAPVLKQPIIAENRGGAGGNIAAAYLARQVPDGYTVMLTIYDGLAIAKAAKLNIGVDPIQDLEPVALVGQNTTLLVVNSKLPIHSFQDLLTHGKAQRTPLSFGSMGVGSPFHLAIERIIAGTGISFTHVPYKGVSNLLLDLVAGRLDFTIATSGILTGHVAKGNMRVVAVGDANRSPLFPDVPTVAESGLPGFSLPIGVALFAPAGTPKPVVSRLNLEINKITRDVQMKARLLEDGLVTVQESPQDLAKRMRADVEQMEQLIARQNLQLQ